VANYLNVPTASGASTPNQAGLAAGSGTVDLRVEVAPTSWASGQFQGLINQYAVGGGLGTRFWLGIRSAGDLEYDFTNANTTPNSVSTVTVGLAGGVSRGIRVLHNIAAGTVNFYTATDFSTWSPLGAQITGFPTLAMGTGGTTPVMRIGTDADLENCPGRITSTQVIINGVTVINMDWTTAPAPGPGPWVNGVAETWTQIGTATVIALPSGKGYAAASDLAASGSTASDA
jgi:hypothetical protein